MADYEIEVASDVGRDPRVADARSIGLRVRRNGEEIASFRLLATGATLDVAHPDAADHPDFWSALVVSSYEAIQEHISDPASLPGDPTLPIDVETPWAAVETVLNSDVELPTLEEGAAVLRWSA